MIAGLLSLPVVVDLVIALALAEGLGLVLWHRATGRGVAPRDFLLNLVSGLCLMLALRLAVGEAGPAGIALALLAAGAAHATDLSLRWRRAGDGARSRISSSRSRPLPRSVSP